MLDLIIIGCVIVVVLDTAALVLVFVVNPWLTTVITLTGPGPVTAPAATPPPYKPPKYQTLESVRSVQQDYPIILHITITSLAKKRSDTKRLTKPVVAEPFIAKHGQMI